MILALFIYLAMILLTALYVAGEFSAVSVRRTRLLEAAESGNRMARWMLPVVEDGAHLDRYVAGCQVGITLTGLLLGAYSQAGVVPPLADLLGGGSGAIASASLVVLVVTTALQVIFGELIPKSVALHAPTQTAILTAWPMRASLWLFAPLIALLNGSGVALLRLLRAPAGGHRHIHSPEEISLLIAESAEGGLLSDQEQDRLDRALRLGMVPVRRLMVPRLEIVGVEQGATLAEVRQRFVDSAFTRLPVYRETKDQIVGVVHAKEVAQHIIAGSTAPTATSLTAGDVMRPIATVPESMHAEQLVQELRRQRSEQAVVIDEHGGVAGLVTIEDLISEVLGVNSGASPDPSAIERTSDGRLRLPGRLRIDTARELLGAEWESESDTVGGFLSERLGHIPAAGERVTIEGVEVEVEAVEQLAVRSLLARPVPGDGEAGP